MMVFLKAGVNSYTFECDGESNEGAFDFADIPANATEITVKKCAINRLLSGSLSNFTNCRILTLWKTNISTVELGAFDGLSQLVTLDMEYNNIQTVQANLFENLKKLETLKFLRNGVKTLYSDSLKGLLSLKTLNLRFHDLETLEPDWFDDLIFLRELRLDGRAETSTLQRLEPFSFRTLNKTERLYLGDNIIEKLEANTFQGLSSLRFSPKGAERVVREEQHLPARNVQWGHTDQWN